MLFSIDDAVRLWPCVTDETAALAPLLGVVMTGLAISVDGAPWPLLAFLFFFFFDFFNDVPSLACVIAA